MSNKKFALITVSDKTGLLLLSRNLIKLGYKIIASKGTTRFLKNHDIDAKEVSTITKWPPIMGKHGIKLIHPIIFGGILADPQDKKHLEDLKKYKINYFNIVVCNFYPFEKTIAKKKFRHEEAIFNLDIGGPAMVRCSAKNYKNVTILTDPRDYKTIIKKLKSEGDVPLKIRERLALKAFKFTFNYDKKIINYLYRKFKA